MNYKKREIDFGAIDKFVNVGGNIELDEFLAAEYAKKRDISTHTARERLARAEAAGVVSSRKVLTSGHVTKVYKVLQ